ncbi:MAG: M3 family metallopeptidase [Rubrivivax sp.]
MLRDFVELPSQLFEHWIVEREVLERHARHVRTGEPIPDDAGRRLQAARPLQPGLRDGALQRERDRRHGGAFAA